MNVSEQVEKIKRRLSITTNETDEVITDLFDDTLSAALGYCNISVEKLNSGYKNTFIVLSIVRESVAGLFNQRGNEGATGYTTGGQGATYEAVYDTMRKKLLQSGCRVWR